MLGAAALVVSGALLFWKKGQEISVAKVETPANSGVKARDIFSRGSEKKENIVATRPTLPAQCQEFWSFLSEQSLKQLSALVASGQFKWDEDCLALKEPKLSQAEILREKCIKAFQEKECQNVLTLYRAEAIAQIYALEKDYSKLDSSVLMNMIMAKFLNGKFAPGDLAAIKDYAKALMAKEPGLYAAEKSYAGALFIETIQNEHAGTEAWDTTMAAMQKLRDSNPTDLEVW